MSDREYIIACIELFSKEEAAKRIEKFIDGKVKHAILEAKIELTYKHIKES